MSRAEKLFIGLMLLSIGFQLGRISVKMERSRAIEGCEIVSRQALADRYEAEDDLWSCKRKVNSLEGTVDCLMFPAECRSKDPNE